MRRLAILCAVLTAAVAGSSGAASAGKIRLAQSSTVTNCMMLCNSQAANCQSNCVIPWQQGGGSTTGNTATAANCQLACSTQQISCQSVCARTSPSP